MTAIKTVSLCKNYKEKEAVKNLDLCIEEGELFALLGVNGAGKTTTIKMLSGLIRQTSGEAEILGKKIPQEASQVREYINVSPQETAVAPNLTVKENLVLTAKIYGKNSEEAEAAAVNVIKEFKLDNIKKQTAKTLSGGWQRRLSIAMALITEPKILFLDEPTLGLDVIARRELWAEIERLKGKVTVILTTHYLEEAEHLADKIAIMADGELKAQGTAQELKALKNTDNFEEAFVLIATKRSDS